MFIEGCSAYRLLSKCCVAPYVTGRQHLILAGVYILVYGTMDHLCVVLSSVINI